MKSASRGVKYQVSHVISTCCGVQISVTPWSKKPDACSNRQAVHSNRSIASSDGKRSGSDDGVEDDNDAKFAALNPARMDNNDAASTLAQALFDYAALAMPPGMRFCGLVLKYAI